MESKKTCPFCGSTMIRLQEGMLRIRVMPVIGGGPGVDRTFLVYRCLNCGRSFDKIEAEEGPEPLLHT